MTCLQFIRCPVSRLHNIAPILIASVFLILYPRRSKHLPLKAVLLVDNAKVHPADLAVGDIRCIYLPPNTASIIQPCDQGKF